MTIQIVSTTDSPEVVKAAIGNEKPGEKQPEPSAPAPAKEPEQKEPTDPETEGTETEGEDGADLVEFPPGIGYSVYIVGAAPHVVTESGTPVLDYIFVNMP